MGDMLLGQTRAVELSSDAKVETCHCPLCQVGGIFWIFPPLPSLFDTGTISPPLGDVRPIMTVANLFIYFICISHFYELTFYIYKKMGFLLIKTYF